MKTLFTKTNANFGCYGKNSDVVKAHTGDIFTIEDVLNSYVPLKDKAWFIRRNCEFTIDEFRQFAIGCALCVLPIYEYKYPKDKVPREAIEAAQAYLKNEISIDELYTKRHAAAAAAYAAYTTAFAAAAAAAYAAAYAAADDAADAYTTAFAAAAAAAYAAADDADDAYTTAFAADAAAAAADAAAADAAAAYAADRLLSFFREFTTQKIEQ